DYRVYIKNSAGTYVKKAYYLADWFRYPQVSDITGSRKIIFDNLKLSYPYTVEICATDSFGLSSTVLSTVVRDTAAEDAVTAAAIDARIAALASKKLEESDAQELNDIRAELNTLSYKVIEKMKKYSDFIDVEAEYYSAFHRTKDSVYAPSASDFFTLAAASKGEIKDSEYIGVTLSWKSATKNMFHGLNKAYALDGLHISFANSKMTSQNKKYAISISNTRGQKWLKNETMLIVIDFETGDVSVGDNIFLGTSEHLPFSLLGATPFDIALNKKGNDYALKINTLYGSDEFTVEGGYISACADLNNLENCYVAFCPWDSQTTGGFDIVAVHDGRSECKKYGEPVSSEENSEVNDKKGCRGGIGGGAFAAVLGVAALAVKKKKNRKAARGNDHA
ncbi:MAG: hypothetical protein IJR61_07340, partial [Clostridia bacterium]|nr:hypothetical protein [Clostridia bacterium]